MIKFAYLVKLPNMQPLQSLPHIYETYEARAKILKALAHPSRLIMVDALADEAKCVCELRDLVGSDMSTISKHLSILKNAGIVLDERRGTMIYYHLLTPCVLNFFDCIESIMRTKTTTIQRVLHKI